MRPPTLTAAPLLLFTGARVLKCLGQALNYAVFALPECSLSVIYGIFLASRAQRITKPARGEVYTPAGLQPRPTTCKEHVLGVWQRASSLIFNICKYIRDFKINQEFMGR